VQVSEAVCGCNLKESSCVSKMGGCLGVANDGVHNGGGTACVGVHVR